MPPMQKHKHYSIKSKINKKKFGDFTSLQTRNEIYEKNKQTNLHRQDLKTCNITNERTDTKTYEM